MKNYLFLRHKVADFTSWKVVYDSHAGARAQAGLTEKKLVRELDQPNNVFILFELEDVAKARAFLGSADLHETMKHSGVIDKPDLHYLQG